MIEIIVNVIEIIVNGVLREDLRCMLPLDPDHGEAYVCDYQSDH